MSTLKVATVALLVGGVIGYGISRYLPEMDH